MQKELFYKIYELVILDQGQPETISSEELQSFLEEPEYKKERWIIYKYLSMPEKRIQELLDLNIKEFLRNYFLDKNSSKISF